MAPESSARAETASATEGRVTFIEDGEGQELRPRASRSASDEPMGSSMTVELHPTPATTTSDRTKRGDQSTITACDWSNGPAAQRDGSPQSL